MTFFDSIILGVVEGLTEFLPISSTAHLILASEALGLSQDAFVKTFEIAIQSGAIFAVIVLYWKRLLEWEVIKKVSAAFIPTAVIGFVLYKLVKSHLIGNVSVVLWSLAIGGVLLIIFELIIARRQRGNVEQVSEGVTDYSRVSYKQAIGIGLVQALAVIPGVSRSAATIIGGLMAGMNRALIVEFSFLLAVPTIVAASGYDLIKNSSAFGSAEIGLFAVGFVAAFITAIIGIKFLLKFIRSRSFIAFGIYRIAVVLIFLLFVF